MKYPKLVCGIDISMRTLDLYYNTEKGKESHFTTTNDQRGYKQILRKLGSNRIYVMERSGPYSLPLAYTLKEAGADIRIENALVIKRYIQMHLERNKSDKKDARWIFRYGMQHDAAVWKKPFKRQVNCQQLLVSIELFNKQITQLLNHKHNLHFLPVINKDVSDGVQQSILYLRQVRSEMEERLEKQITAWQKDHFNNLLTIPGIGKRTASLLIVYTHGFRDIVNHRQIIALAGLAPREHTSGSSVRGKKGICKMGYSRLRSALYMCALSARKCNKACMALYDRLIKKGKPVSVALIAVCNKLIKQAFAIASKNTPYDEEYFQSLQKKAHSK